MKALGVLVAALQAARSGIQDAAEHHDRRARESRSACAMTTLTLFFVAIANLFSKQIATISGVGFTLCHVSSSSRSPSRRIAKRAMKRRRDWSSSISRCSRKYAGDAIHARPGCILVAVRDYNRMAHLQSVLQKTNLRRHDIVVMTVRGSFLRRRRIRAWPRTSCSPTTSGNCSRASSRWRRRKARPWICWSCPA